MDRTDLAQAKAAAFCKSAVTSAEQIRLAHFARRFASAASQPRAAAEALMKGWAASSDPLQKGLAQHWLDRARASIEHGIAPAAGTARPRPKPAAKPAAKAMTRRSIHPLIARHLARAKKSGQLAQTLASPS